jgi:hypothetical protein
VNPPLLPLDGFVGVNVPDEDEMKLEDLPHASLRDEDIDDREKGSVDFCAECGTTEDEDDADDGGKARGPTVGIMTGNDAGTLLTDGGVDGGNIRSSSLFLHQDMHMHMDIYTLEADGTVMSGRQWLPGLHSSTIFSVSYLMSMTTDVSLLMTRYFALSSESSISEARAIADADIGTAPDPPKTPPPFTGVLMISSISNSRGSAVPVVGAVDAVLGSDATVEGVGLGPLVLLLGDGCEGGGSSATTTGGCCLVGIGTASFTGSVDVVIDVTVADGRLSY